MFWLEQPLKKSIIFSRENPSYMDDINNGTLHRSSCAVNIVNRHELLIM